MLPSSRREESCVTSTCIRGPWLSPFQQYPPLLTTSICPSISLILLSRIIMLPCLHRGPPPGAVSELRCPLSERKPSLPSLTPLLTHRIHLHARLRFSTHAGWPSTSHLHDCSPTPTDLTYTLSLVITPPLPSSIHSWMVRTRPRLKCQILLTSSPTIPLLITRAASSLLLSLTFNPSHLQSAGCRLLPCCLPRHFGCVSNRVRHGQGVTPRWLRLAWTVGMACWNA